MHALRGQKSIKDALNKAYLSAKPMRSEIELFKRELSTMLNRVKQGESEEHHKNLLSDFLKKVYYEKNHYINTKGRQDLVIHNGKDSSSSVGVIVEAKKPSNRGEMARPDDLNVKAMQELLLYYLTERIVLGNLEIRHLIVTNVHEWYVFDAKVFEREFAQNSGLQRAFHDFHTGRMSGTTTDFFYREIAAPLIESIKDDLQWVYFDLRNYQAALESTSKSGERSLIELFKMLSPEHLLKLPFANDSNTLDRRFYAELLHIVGLEERRDGAKRLIGRKPKGSRDGASLLENAIEQLDALDKLSRLEKPDQFGSDKDERLFNVGLELTITWINRVLFLKLLEAQLIKFNDADVRKAFLNGQRIKSFDDLNTLFFQVLARKFEDRSAETQKRFGHIPYLNSSLFELTDLEHDTLTVGGLTENQELKIHSSTVLKDPAGRKRTGAQSALSYLFDFLNAYDFASTGKEAVQEEDKSLISASVLGLIFEKINGYKEGSFYTPGLVTMYMCKESIRRAVVGKFNIVKNWNCESLSELYEKIEDSKEANEIVNSLRICDPAVGSGHFLVSALNELIAIKSELRILQDVQGKRLKEYTIDVVADELHILDEDGEVFEYKPRSRESQRVQEAVFHEKQRLIENCLFGVDVNPNSVKICRLRLWIELLKHAYFRSGEELETLPNIDINIKKGNSLISRFALDSDLKRALRKSGTGLKEYRHSVSAYRNARTKEEKRSMERIIGEIKAAFRAEINTNDPRSIRHSNAVAEIETLTRQRALFEESARERKARLLRIDKLSAEAAKLAEELEEVRKSKVYEHAFEWRFEFPEALDDSGDFRGFDVVVGNPPYGVAITGDDRTHLVETVGKVPDYEIYYWFINRSRDILAKNGVLSFIIPNTILFNVNAQNYRISLTENWALDELLDCTDFQVFADATVRNAIISARKESGDAIGYRNTMKASSFLDLVERPTLQVSKETLLANNQNWALVFKLPAEVTSIVGKIRALSTPLSTHFSKTSQGLIAYDKYQGQDEATIKARAFHASSQLTPDYKPWLNGADVARYAVQWSGKEFIKYGKEIANPRDPAFFIGRRVLIREITNPRIFAALTAEELYNDPAVLIVKDEPSSPLPLEALLAILNSKIASFYHFNASPKATKGAFPKILVFDVNNFPLPKKIDADVCARLAAAATRLSDGQTNAAERDYLEREINRMVYGKRLAAPS